MNVDQLYELSDVLDEDLSQIAPAFAALAGSLGQLSGAPADAGAQLQVSSDREALETALRAARSNDFPPSYYGWMDELGLNFADASELLLSVDAAFVGNDLTVSTAQGLIQELSDKVAQLTEQITAVLAALRFMGIQENALAEDEFALGIQVPRSEVDNSLEGLGREFGQLNRLVQPFVELTSGSPPPLEVRSISSSDFGVYLGMLPGAAAAAAYALDKVLDIYKKYLDIREIKQRMLDAEVDDEVVAALDADTTERFRRGLDGIAADVIESFGTPAARNDHEIRIKIEHSIEGLAQRIDAGFSFEVRVGEGSEADDVNSRPESEYREVVASRQHAMRYSKLRGARILSIESAFVEQQEAVDSDVGND